MVIKTYTARVPAEESLVSTSGFMLGVLGGLLDFASATSIAINQGGSGMMSGYLLAPDAWALLLVALGILVVVAAVLSVTSTGVMHLKGFSVLMVLLGIVMALIGTLMSGGSIQGASTIYSYAMVIVGALMAINGAMMIRTPIPI
jgi:peptidoglycan/LPS O-acetylase OafA/YrhL